MNPKEFLGKEKEQQVVAAITHAEAKTSGEIRVHIESKCSGDVLDRAAWIFKKLKMHATKERNGVLIYLSLKDRKFAIIGDAGIHNVVPEGFWDEIKELMVSHFRNGDFAQGLISGIEMSGEQLKKYFPAEANEANELPDDISFGK